MLKETKRNVKETLKQKSRVKFKKIMKYLNEFDFDKKYNKKSFLIDINEIINE